jgi:hypothetical protein
MRAVEFINEGAGKISKRQDNPTIGLNTFIDGDHTDRLYELNRVMMATAATDGTFVPDVDNESWVGRNNLAAPYTQEEQNMLKMAYKAIGSTHTDINNGDLKSKEHPAVNITSPMQAFKGYK